MSRISISRLTGALLLTSGLAAALSPALAQRVRPVGPALEAAVRLPQPKLTAFGLPDLGTPGTTQIGHYGTNDSAMVCGRVPTVSPAVPYGTGYVVSRKDYYPGQATGTLNLSKYYRVVKYQTSATGVTSSLVGGVNAIGNPHALPRTYLDMTIVGGDPFAGTAAAVRDRTFAFGGRLASAFSNEFFAYDEATGFRLPTAPNGSAQISMTPSANMLDRMLPSPRAAMAGTSIGNNKIMLVGGFSASGVSPEVFFYDRAANTWDQKASLPLGLKGARLLPAGSAGSVQSVYLVGGSTSAGGTADNRRIYRFAVPTGTGPGSWALVKDAGGNPIEIPGTNQLEIASVLGNMTVLTQSEDQVAMIAYTFTHPNPSGIGSVLNSFRFDQPARARGGFGLLRCSPDAWVIGGAYGHGPTFNDRGTMTDKLVM